MYIKHSFLLYFLNMGYNTHKCTQNKVIFQHNIFGVPLISTRLSVADCGALLERIIGSIYSWLFRNLSHVGRLQLLSPVLYSLKDYWTAIFILPKNIIKAIEQRLIGSFGMGRLKGLPRLRFLGMSCVYLRRNEAWG
jgi:hypothetical protein